MKKTKRFSHHSILLAVLKKLGRDRGFETGKSNKTLKEFKEKENYEIRPDVVWEKDGKIKCIFEVDKGAYDKYPKTIFGSMLGGIVLSKYMKCVFYEVTFKN